jgi:hypothetical protein
LRRRPVPVVSRIEDGRVWLDLRTVEETDDAILGASLADLRHLRRATLKIPGGDLNGH